MMLLSPSSDVMQLLFEKEPGPSLYIFLNSVARACSVRSLRLAERVLVVSR